MTPSEHRREHRRGPSGQEHRRIAASSTADHITAGQSIDGSIDGIDAPEHRRLPPFLKEGATCSTPADEAVNDAGHEAPSWWQDR